MSSLYSSDVIKLTKDLQYIRNIIIVYDNDDYRFIYNLVDQSGIIQKYSQNIGVTSCDIVYEDKNEVYPYDNLHFVFENEDYLINIIDTKLNQIDTFYIDYKITDSVVIVLNCVNQISQKIKNKIVFLKKREIKIIVIVQNIAEMLNECENVYDVLEKLKQLIIEIDIDKKDVGFCLGWISVGSGFSLNSLNNKILNELQNIEKNIKNIQNIQNINRFKIEKVLSQNYPFSNFVPELLIKYQQDNHDYIFHDDPVIYVLRNIDKSENEILILCKILSENIRNRCYIKMNEKWHGDKLILLRNPTPGNIVLMESKCYFLVGSTVNLKTKEYIN